MTGDEQYTSALLPWRFPGAWADDALCAQTDPDLFFPEKGGTALPAINICRQCSVASECLEFALTNRERFGIWGGLSERERRRLYERRAS